MPNYEYYCTKCDHSFEQIVPCNERDSLENTECPECHKKAIKRGVSAVRLSYSSPTDMFTRAGNGWKEVQDKIKKGSGRRNSIRTK